MWQNEDPLILPSLTKAKQVPNEGQNITSISDVIMKYVIFEWDVIQQNNQYPECYMI